MTREARGETDVPRPDRERPTEPPEDPSEPWEPPVPQAPLGPEGVPKEEDPGPDA